MQCHKSHYDILKVSQNASQADIKAAYYKLSKQYHPDANVNDPSSTEKFQELNEAYEVLGNEDSRLRYDKGMAPVDRMTSSRKAGFKVPEDPRAAFYKARLQNKMKVPTTGRIYNFDDWTKNHYSASIQSNRVLKAKETKARGINYTQFDGERPAKAKDQLQLERRVAMAIVAILIVVSAIYELDQPDAPKALK